MVKSSTSEKNKKLRGPGGATKITEKNIEFIEKDTMQKVNRALSALETAIAKWDGAKDKPEDLVPKFKKYKRYHDALAQWEKKMLKNPGRGLDFYARVERLGEFANICYAYQ